MRGVQAQMTFLLMQYQGDTRVLAAVLDVRRRTVERHERGSLLPPRRALRERLRARTSISFVRSVWRLLPSGTRGPVDGVLRGSRSWPSR